MGSGRQGRKRSDGLMAFRSSPRWRRDAVSIQIKANGNAAIHIKHMAVDEGERVRRKEDAGTDKFLDTAHRPVAFVSSASR